MKKKIYMVGLMLAVCLYFIYWFTKRYEFALLAVFAMFLSSVFRIIYDIKNHSLPWTKTTEQKDKDIKHELDRRDRILQRLRRRDMKKASKAGKLDEFLEQDKKSRAESDKKYKVYKYSEADTEYVLIKRDEPGSKQSAHQQAE